MNKIIIAVLVVSLIPFAYAIDDYIVDYHIIIWINDKKTIATIYDSEVIYCGGDYPRSDCDLFHAIQNEIIIEQNKKIIELLGDKS